MAVTWVRGPRCGVNNCTSRFYHVSSGHRVCQNGHVQEGLEAAADDDDFGAIGRRINIPRQQAAPQAARVPKVVHGHEAFVLTLSLMQDVLMAQVDWLRTHQGLGVDFARAVRSLWTAYVALVIKPSTRMSNMTLSLRDLVVLCYFAMRCGGKRVLLIDFLRWIPLADFPFISSQKWLDAKKFGKVPIEQRRVFMGIATPTRLSLHRRALSLRPQLEGILHTRIPRVDRPYALLRLCRELMLPPEMYVAADSLLRNSMPSKKAWTCEELPMALALVMATKLAYGLDGLPRVLAETRRGEQIDWHVWKDVVQKIWSYQPNPTVADERLAMFWDATEMDRYLSWQQHRILPQDKPGDRLLSMFPLRTAPPDYEVVDDDTLTELTSVVHSTSSPHEVVAETPDPNLAAGSSYQIYASRRESLERLPEVIETLYEVIGVLFNTNEVDVRRVMRGFEGWARANYGREAFFDIPQHHSKRRRRRRTRTPEPMASEPEIEAGNKST